MKHRRNVLLYTLLISLYAFLVLLFLIGPKEKSEKELIIYDVHDNSPRIVKDDGSIEFADYVRIRNMTDQPYDLSGLYLSDSSENLKKLPLDGVMIKGGSSEMIKLDPSWNFAIKRSGNESIYLSDSNGKILFRYNSSMKPNTPTLSANSGFYEDEFDLKMFVKGDYTIRYTLDGSEPDEDSEEYIEPIRVYDRSGEPNTVVSIRNTVEEYLEPESEQPIYEPVDKAFLVRAVAIDSYGNKSDIVTREYFFCGAKYKNIVSIIADPDDLFGDFGIVSVGKEYVHPVHAAADATMYRQRMGRQYIETPCGRI